MDIPTCSKCGTPLVKKPNKPFWVCPNWTKDGTGCEGEIWFPPRETKKTGGFQKAVPTIANHQEIMEALRKLWVEIESLKKEFKEFVKIFGKKNV